MRRDDFTCFDLFAGALILAGLERLDRKEAQS